MSANLPLRDYQQECLDDNERDLAAGDNRLMDHGATGLGKTVIMTHQANNWAKAGDRTLVIAHRKELITQTIDKFTQVAPEIPVGRVQALSGLSKSERARQVSADNGVLVGSIASLRDPAAWAELPQIDRLIIDEAHHSAADSYMNLMEALGSWRGLPTIGYSATPARADKRKLGDTWKLSWQRDIRFGIEHGHLVNLKGKTIPLTGEDGKPLDLGKIRRAYVEEAAGSDMVPSLLASAMQAADAEEQIARKFNEESRDESGEVQSTLGFCPSVPFCYSLQETLARYGIRSEVIEGKTPPEDRERWLQEYTDGELKVLLNFNVLTEGTDLPRTRIILMARPTTSTPLYTQCVGRGTRPHRESGKTHCLVLDVVGISREHNLASLADLSTTPIDVQEGETLYEAMLRADTEGESESFGPALVEGGVLELEDFDFFAAQSRRVWLETPAGCRFASVEAHAYVGVPMGHGLYNLGRSPDPVTKVKGETLRTGLTLQELFDFGESFAAEEERQLGVFGTTYSTAKDASWRKGRQPATEAQLGKVRRENLPIPNAARMTKAELSDAINIVKISRRYDRFVTTTRSA